MVCARSHPARECARRKSFVGGQPPVAGSQVVLGHRSTPTSSFSDRPVSLLQLIACFAHSDDVLSIALAACDFDRLSNSKARDDNSRSQPSLQRCRHPGRTRSPSPSAARSPAPTSPVCAIACARFSARARRSSSRCDVAGVEPDAVTVDALARLQLAARRRGCHVRLCNVPRSSATSSSSWV